jgi:hypothetical protein
MRLPRLLGLLLDEQPGDRDEALPHRSARTVDGAHHEAGLTDPVYRARAACARARYFASYSYGAIKNILRKGLDLQPLPDVVLPERGRHDWPATSRRRAVRLPRDDAAAPVDALTLAAVGGRLTHPAELGALPIPQAIVSGSQLRPPQQSEFAVHIPPPGTHSGEHTNSPGSCGWWT